MAFVAALSDFFSCGRTRKAREPPLDPNDTASEPVTHETATPTLALPPIDEKTTLDVHVREPADKAGEAGRIPSIQQPDVRPTSNSRHRNSADDNMDMFVVQEKAKPSAGWVVEQQILVTAMPAAVTEEAEKTASVPEPEPEFETTTITPPVRCATPEQEPWNSTPVARSATPELAPEPVPEPEVSIVTPTVRPVTPEPETTDIVSVRSATPEIEAVAPQLAIPEPEEFSLPAFEELVPSIPEPEIMVRQLPAASKRTTPVTFLNMPPEVRNKIYEQMNEDGPIRMCRSDDPALALRDGESARAQRRQFYNLTQVCREIRNEFLPVYARKTEYIIDLWGQRANLSKVETLNAKVSMDIDAACFDMEPIDLLPLLRCLVRAGRTDCRFTSTEGVVFRSISEIVDELNKLLPAANGSNKNWLEAISGPMKRIDLHLFPHDDIRQYYRFRGAEPLVRVVYPSAKSEEWMKRASKSQEYEAYLRKTGLDKFEMHVVIGHASRRTTNEGRLPLDWRMSYQLRQSTDRAPRLSMEIAAARMSIDRSPRR
ncbi:hypothetical protein COCVIDRAFT_15477 [Bipolaris victoriae FI3]|uniref:Uncharacterized protein n=1 Tax=Bipolaris victoriae (strain FI3) TaxID=930091 RepID=W7EBE1_BIPV3|nr:hypothetical protein COCVIDRAFT_15477 [Bipolaris victoriae FI3]